MPASYKTGAHLLADDPDELHRFAALLGIKRPSFQGPPRASTPHYDLTGYERGRDAISLGAIACRSRADRAWFVVGCATLAAA